MKPPAQKPDHRCEHCGLLSLVIKITPWEFEYRCPCGKASGVISWAHANPPPTLTGAELIQLELETRKETTA